LTGRARASEVESVFFGSRAFSGSTSAIHVFVTLIAGDSLAHDIATRIAAIFDEFAGTPSSGGTREKLSAVRKDRRDWV
jgi:hypothetical protein